MGQDEHSQGAEPDVSIQEVPFREGERKFRVLTFNCWGLKYVSRQRRQRIHAIAEYIVSSSSANASSRPSHSTSSGSGSAAVIDEGDGGYDLVALQELWCEEDWLTISTRAKSVGLKHGRWFYSGALGSGLAILTRHRLLSSSILSYPLNGNPLHVAEGDWHVGKAAGSVIISLDIPSPSSSTSKGESTKVELELINTHFYAPHGDEGAHVEEWKRAHRIAQCWELGKIVRSASERGRGVIVTGDLNSPPHSHVIRFLLAHGHLSDSFPVLNPQAPHPSRSSSEAVRLNGVTCDSPLNSFSRYKVFPEWVRKEGGKRLDYVLFRNSGLFVPKEETRKDVVGSVNLEPKWTKVVLTEPVPGTGGMSYSDHFGVEVVFGVSLLTTSASSTKPSFPGGEAVPSSEPLSGPGRPSALTPELMSTSLNALARSFSSSSKAANTQMSLFYLAIVSIPLVAIAASFQPNKAFNWLFVLVGVGIGWGGTTMLYAGFIGGRWERRALRNVIAEMEIERERLWVAREEEEEDGRFSFEPRIWG
ncbi:hypothetical protein BT69DRAFT_1238775 [Atractiella rhizophila]|nr:hypothetical protein BT69DRAFT_1238775 [Atractiella rhizophila]